MIPGLGRSPGEGKGYPLQYPGLENYTDCIVQGVAKSRTRLSDFHFHFPMNQQMHFRDQLCSPLWWKLPGVGLHNDKLHNPLRGVPGLEIRGSSVHNHTLVQVNADLSKGESFVSAMVLGVCVCVHLLSHV